MIVVIYVAGARVQRIRLMRTPAGFRPESRVLSIRTAVLQK